MEILGIILLVPLGGVTVAALFTVLILLAPTPVEKTRDHLEKMSGRSLLLGVINLIFFGLISGLFLWLAEQSGGLLSGVLVFLAAVILIGVLIFILFGLSAFANLLGERMGGGKTPFTSNLRGAALLLLAALAPYIGWFIFTPLILWAGLGAAISALVRKEKEIPT